jgi:hypothetical protein
MSIPLSEPFSANGEIATLSPVDEAATTSSF